MNTKKRLEDYSWDELLELTSGKEGMKEAGRDSGKYTLDNHLGIHTEDEELRREWARMGGEATIEKLLQWQVDNNFRVCDLERTDEWCNNISIAMTGRKIPKSVRDKIRKTLKAKIDSMSPEERSEKYASYSFAGKNHKEESKELMRRKAYKRVDELGENYIPKERREKMREENGDRIAVYLFDASKKNNKGKINNIFFSIYEANKFYKTQIGHCLH